MKLRTVEDLTDTEVGYIIKRAPRDHNVWDHVKSMLDPLHTPRAFLEAYVLEYILLFGEHPWP